MTQSISRTAKPVSFYIQNEPIDALTARYGDYLDRLTPQQRCLLGSVIFDHMAACDFPSYGIVESLCSVDPDKVLGDDLWQMIESIANDSTADELASLLVALAALVCDDARNGGFE